ncbi:IS3 family transposase [Candidatus Phytoplasma solani]|uniref:IS3 family transposase n=1 Tax=Candidatus Phytoplasma solani TaxID=69896 RepID=UPI0032DBE4EB
MLEAERALLGSLFLNPEKMKYLTENQVKNIIHKYMHYYNYKRKMKILNYLSPIEYKKKYFK